MGGASGSLVTLRNNVVSLIAKQNDPGADYNISDGLRRTVVTVEAGEPVKGMPTTRLPCVLVSVSEYAHNLSQLGSGARRAVEYGLDVYAVTCESGTGYADAQAEAMQLTDNLLSLFRAKHDLSMTGLWHDEVTVTMDEQIESGTYVKIAHINLRCHEIA